MALTDAEKIAAKTGNPRILDPFTETTLAFGVGDEK